MGLLSFMPLNDQFNFKAWRDPTCMIFRLVTVSTLPETSSCSCEPPDDLIGYVRDGFLPWCLIFKALVM